MEVTDITGIEQSADKGQNRIAQITMQRRHCTGFDTALKAVTHNEVVAFPQFFNKRIQMQEIVTVICISHDDILALCGVTSTNQRCAVSTLSNIYYTRTTASCDILRSIGTAIIRNKDLAFYTALFQIGPCLLDTHFQCLCFVQTGH